MYYIAVPVRISARIGYIEPLVPVVTAVPHGMETRKGEYQRKRQRERGNTKEKDKEKGGIPNKKR